MRPATRAVPKSFLPLIDRPAIQYAVEEAAAAGATEVFAVVEAEVTSLVEMHFRDPLAGLEHVTVTAVVQDEPLGLGDAVRCAAEAVGERQFMCLLVDEVLRPGRDVLGPLIEAAGADSAVALRTVEDESELSRYGVVAIAGPGTGPIVTLAGAVEKPAPGAAPSNLALLGRYVFAPEVFDALADLEPGYGGELQLTDAIDAISARCKGVVADDSFLDVGHPLGLAKAKHLLAMDNPEWGSAYRRFVAEES